MAVKYIPYFPDTLSGQALLDNFVRTKRVLRYRDNNRVIERIQRGMPLYEMEQQERVGNNSDGNLVVRGECLSACAYLKDRGVAIDLVYIDPPFASGADYAKQVHVRRNPKVAEAIKQAENKLDIEELRSFEEKMYGDIWDKERYLNWMYENLMAIRSVMSDNASIYVHLDWHIGHYVKILMDEIFGEENFQREIIWDIQVLSGFKTIAPNWVRGHDSIYYYSKSEERIFNKQYQQQSEKYIARFNKVDEKGRRYFDGRGERRYLGDVMGKGKPYGDVWSDIMSFQQQPTSDEKVDYATQKPTALLERIIKASSNEGMVVADFFGGSGVTAVVANRLGRKFVHCDVGINSVQTVRDRLIADKAEFDILDVKDGVSLYRNPVQTMDKLKKLIPGLRNEDLPNKFWSGSITDSQHGMMPVYIPNLTDGTTRFLDIPLISRILFEAMPELPDETKRVIVYFIEIDDREAIEQFIHDNNNTLIEIDLRDLKQILDDIVAQDYAEWEVTELKVSDNVFERWNVDITVFQSDRVNKKIDEYNLNSQKQALHSKVTGTEKEYKPITISENGLETIEWLSVDCSTGEQNAPWHSDSEIKIDKLGYVVKNGCKTGNLWDGSIKSEHKPLRLKIRNICGDETIFTL